MAKKKTTTTVEEETNDSPEQELDYNEIHDNNMKDLATDDIPVVEEVKEEVKEEKEEPVAEEKVVETPPVEPKIDPEQLKKDIAEETTQKIVQALKGDTQEETTSNKNDYQKWAEAFIEKNNHAPEYTDAFEFLEERAFQRLEAKQEESRRAQEEQVTQQKTQEEQAIAQFNKEVDEELTELYTNNKLPKIKDKDDPTDTGIIARKALFQTMADVNIKRVADGLAPIRSIARIHNIYYKSPSTQPPGVDAPIAGDATSSASANDEQELDYLRDVKGGFRNMFKRG